MAADLAELQYQFAAHLRDPEHAPAPEGIEDRRMGIYRNLFFNSLNSLLSKNFPVLHKVLGAQRWKTLVRDFYRDYRAKTPLFTELPRDFLGYLQQRQESGSHDDPPFMLELAHYEWVELALGISEHDLDAFHLHTEPDLLDGPLQLSPLAWVLGYRFPVHRIGPDYQPEHAPESATHLVVVRNRQDTISFIELNAVSARLLALVQASPGGPARAHLQQIAAELGSDAESLIAPGMHLLQQLRDRNVLLWLTGCQQPVGLERS